MQIDLREDPALKDKVRFVSKEEVVLLLRKVIVTNDFVTGHEDGAADRGGSLY